MLAIVWCECPYDTSGHLHGPWCASMRVGGASPDASSTFEPVALGSHASHIASDAVRSPLVATGSDVMEGEAAQGGGARMGCGADDCYDDWRRDDANPFLVCPACYLLLRERWDNAFDDVVEAEADELPIGTVSWYPTRATHDTWLERIPRRWPARVS